MERISPHYNPERLRQSGIDAREIGRIVRAPRALVLRDLRIRTQGSTSIDLAVGRARRDHDVGRDSLFDPTLHGRQCVKRIGGQHHRRSAASQAPKTNAEKSFVRSALPCSSTTLL